MINMMENTLLNIVIPMAGLGSRFSNQGYEKPKPFVDVLGKPMIVNVLENLKYDDARYILIARKEHLEQEAEIVAQIQRQFNAVIIPIEETTEGTACTVLYAREFINNNEPLMIANSDQIVDLDIMNFIDDSKERALDGSILTFIDKSKNPKWSFAKTDKNGFVIEVKEKKAISNIATVGVYLFRKGKFFIDASLDMIIRNDRVNNEFYTCPCFNYAIKDNKKIGIFNILETAMHGIGTPEDLEKYIYYKSNLESN
jgi:UDP-N-acetylglucosamine diphosphorylase / glucose-1-phosphate thymidylyltransferase / UDP-N-acetylgalactosamine diphosphorylase / glucosamine-1-phosphate N-acetyltransferase / galactosamine-1-phosphate N-acetyltransferase